MNSTTTTLAMLAACGLALVGCGESGNEGDHGHSADTQAQSEDAHTHADGSTHGDHADGEQMDEEDHDHDEVALDPVSIDGMSVELAQNHGAIDAGQESHLVVKLPYSDNGGTIIRAWIGTEDRTLSFVGKGEYAASHDDYDIHVMAPDPLPENTMWWIEIEKPDGTKTVGSATPILE